jgi:hypothetical protein
VKNVDQKSNCIREGELLADMRQRSSDVMAGYSDGIMKKILEKNRSVELNQQIMNIERQDTIKQNKQKVQRVHANQTLIRMEEQKRNNSVIEKHNKIIENGKKRKADYLKFDLLQRNQNIYLQNELHNVSK